MGRLEGKIDLLVCNPPYVATGEEEVGGQDISAAWAGGDLGLNVTNEVIRVLGKVMSQSGVAYIAVEQCNRPDELVETVRETLGLSCEVVLQRRAGREFLKV